MASLSNGASSFAPRRDPGGTRAVFVVASALVFAVFAVVTLNERGTVRHTLRAIVPAEVAPGRPFPVVARLFAHEGPSLVREIEEGTIDVELARKGEVIFRGALDRAGGPYFGASVLAPRREGRYAVVLRRAGAEARASVVVARDPEPSRLMPLPAALRVEIRRAEAATGAELRVASGVCVPEHSCELFVLERGSGEGARLVPRAGLTVTTEGAREPHVTSFTTFSRGLAAEVEVELASGGSIVAGLPVASGGVALRSRRRLLVEGDSVTLDVASLSDPPHLVTHHRDGALVAVFAARAEIRLRDLRPGVHRVQAGGDLFDPQSLARAGASVFVVGARGDAASASLRRAATALDALELDDPFEAPLLRSSSELAARALLARLERHRAMPPEAVTGESGARDLDRSRVSSVRLAGALFIALLGAWVAIVAIRAERLAAARAEEAARRAGVAVWVRPARGARLRLGMALLVVYLLAAAALLSRFWIFG